MTIVKICGVTTFNDARFAAQAGADMLGLNFYPPSPRYLTPDRAATLAEELRSKLGESCPVLVGVFANEKIETIQAIIDQVGLDLAQLSGDEPLSDIEMLGERGFKAIRPQSVVHAVELAKNFLPHAPQDDRFPALLLDAYHPSLYGGTGHQASNEVIEAVTALTSRLMLAGGLNPENVKERVQATQAWGVDVASGVEGETKGIKDKEAVKKFIQEAKS